MKRLSSPNAFAKSLDPQSTDTVPEIRIVQLRRTRKISASRYKHILAKQKLERDGVPFSIDAINRTASEVKHLIVTDPEIGKAAAEWAEERNKDSISTRDRAISLLKATIRDSQAELAKLGVTVITSGIVNNRGFEIRDGPLIKSVDKFLMDASVRLNLVSVLEAVAVRENSKMVLGYCNNVVRECNKGRNYGKKNHINKK